MGYQPPETGGSSLPPAPSETRSLLSWQKGPPSPLPTSCRLTRTSVNSHNPGPIAQGQAICCPLTRGLSLVLRKSEQEVIRVLPQDVYSFPASTMPGHLSHKYQRMGDLEQLLVSFLLRHPQWPRDPHQVLAHNQCLLQRDQPRTQTSKS